MSPLGGGSTSTWPFLLRSGPQAVVVRHVPLGGSLGPRAWHVTLLWLLTLLGAWYVALLWLLALLGGGGGAVGGLAARVLGTLHKNRTKSLFSPTKDHIKDQKPRKILKEESPNNLNPECECPNPKPSII